MAAGRTPHDVGRHRHHPHDQARHDRQEDGCAWPRGPQRRRGQTSGIPRALVSRVSATRAAPYMSTRPSSTHSSRSGGRKGRSVGPLPPQGAPPAGAGAGDARERARLAGVPGRSRVSGSGARGGAADDGRARAGWPGLPDVEQSAAAHRRPEHAARRQQPVHPRRWINPGRSKRGRGIAQIGRVGFGEPRRSLGGGGPPSPRTSYGPNMVPTLSIAVPLIDARDVPGVPASAS
jgi:hypothetical protein